MATTLGPLGVEVHSYLGVEDLSALVELTRFATGVRWPSTTGFHVGDIVWGLVTATGGCQAPVEGLRLYTRRRAVVGFVWFESPGHFLMDVRPGTDIEAELYDELVSFAERYRRRADLNGGTTLTTLARASDEARVALLEARGYVAQSRADPRMRRSLETPIARADLPSGFRFQDCRDANLDERAAAHRDAWSHLAHLGLESASSGFTVQVYEQIRAAPVYDPELDLVVVAPDGKYAACCICWADIENRVGLFEPVGTRFAYRRLGLARALNLEGLRRLHAKGMTSALIGTAAFNEPARATYLSCGFEVIDEDRWFEKRLD
jgi:mycothiol synthase